MSRAVVSGASLEYPEIAHTNIGFPRKEFVELLSHGWFDSSTYLNSVATPTSLLAADESITFSNSFDGDLAPRTFLPSGGNDARTQNFNVSTAHQGMANAEEHRLLAHSAKYKSMVPSRLPIPSSSAYFTIPPGLSPTVLLDSPIKKADLSPISGALYEISMEESAHLLPIPEPTRQKHIICKDQDSKGSLNGPVEGSFRPQVVCVPPSDVSPSASMPATDSAAAQTPGLLHNVSHIESLSDPCAYTSECAEVANDVEVSNIFHYADDRHCVDGYNWKKYGQKQLKGTEFPRSYYKCTHPNCPVKKQVEQSNEGEITEIMYKGEHNHPKPQGKQRVSRTGGQLQPHEKTNDIPGTLSKTESCRTSEIISTSLTDRLPRTSEQPFGSRSSNEGDDFEQERSLSEREDGHDIKRRRSENMAHVLPIAPITAIREPRVIVQTTTEIDILDDGYRWRKYGQKVVKGNRFPRSYYKCTNIGCNVRKHVERSSTDPTSVMTAYEGKHNHNVPRAQGSVQEPAKLVAADTPHPTKLVGHVLPSVHTGGRTVMGPTKEGSSDILGYGCSGSRQNIDVSRSFSAWF
ncbi:hypothetical protein KP509_21G017100 [Ceratopteris richardii]|uniref:WRKY domain-containing protein n=1 Tax=Ceratopteris richardii TaxID=49495 RepID=A0A8T2SAI3_CERRI|nr:hypothetical protein KP509_21G017100 [Ceratopteris richardii]